MKKRILLLFVLVFTLFFIPKLALSDGVNLFYSVSKTNIWFNDTGYYMKNTPSYNFKNFGITFEGSISRAISIELGGVYTEIKGDNKIIVKQDENEYELKNRTEIKAVRVPVLIRVYLLNEELSPAFITGVSFYGILSKDSKNIFPQEYKPDKAVIFPVWQPKNFYANLHFGFSLMFLPETLKLEFGLLYTKSISSMFYTMVGAKEVKTSSLEIFIKKSF